MKKKITITNARQVLEEAKYIKAIVQEWRIKEWRRMAGPRWGKWSYHADKRQRKEAING